MNHPSLSSHVLDTHLGRPACGVAVALRVHGASHPIATAITNDDGRITMQDWGLDAPLSKGRYTLTFSVQSYFEKQNISPFYTDIVIDFFIKDASHYHIPLLLSAHGYSTYRGS